MRIPEEDLPPSWLRDYGEIEADISRMEEFAHKLEAEVRENYAPHLTYVYDDMGVQIPPPYAEFAELASFLRTHHTAAQDTTDMVHFYQNATGGFATAAAKVSERYRDADAFAAARVRDVEAAFDGTSTVKPQDPGVTGPTTGPSTTDPTTVDPTTTTELP